VSAHDRPQDDGACDHLPGLTLPPFELAATDGSAVRLDNAPGRTIVFAYPRTGIPGEDAAAPAASSSESLPARGGRPPAAALPAAVGCASRS
jgi:hypothetical protein